MKITDTVKYVGVNDADIYLFEGQYITPCGMAYNSYVILDEKIAVMDSVGEGFFEEWIANINRETNGKNPDYLIVHHMEPDHSYNVFNFMKAYPEATIVSSAKAFTMMKNFFGTDFSDRRIVVGEGSKLSLGSRELSFIAAPMVHWPEVIVSYDGFDKILFSADGFGKFGTLDTEEEWACEARRYYFGIVGKYGAQVQSLLKKASALEIKTVCPLHGPVLSENLGYYFDLYDKWSSYTPETDGVAIAFASVYGNTERAVLLLADKLKELGCPAVSVTDLTMDDMAEAIEDAFRYSKLVLATPTYNADVFPAMREFISGLTERSYQNRTVAFIENGSWAPSAKKVMLSMLEGAKNLTYAENSVKIMSALNETSTAELTALAEELTKEYK